MVGSVARRSVSGDMEMESSGSNTVSRSLEFASRKCMLNIKVRNGGIGALRSELCHHTALIPDLRGGWGGMSDNSRLLGQGWQCPAHVGSSQLYHILQTKPAFQKNIFYSLMPVLHCLAEWCPTFYGACLGLTPSRSKNILTTPSCQCIAAHERGVKPYLVSTRSMLTSFRSKSIFTTPP